MYFTKEFTRKLRRKLGGGYKGIDKEIERGTMREFTKGTEREFVREFM